MTQTSQLLKLLDEYKDLIYDAVIVFIENEESYTPYQKVVYSWVYHCTFKLESSDAITEFNCLKQRVYMLYFEEMQAIESELAKIHRQAARYMLNNSSSLKDESE